MRCENVGENDTDRKGGSRNIKSFEQQQLCDDTELCVKDKDHFCLLLWNWLPAVLTTLTTAQAVRGHGLNITWKHKIHTAILCFPSSPKSPPQNHFSPQPQKHIFSSKLKPWVMLETTYKPMSKDSQCPQRVDLSWVIFTCFLSEKTKCLTTESLSEEQTMWA